MLNGRLVMARWRAGWRVVRCVMHVLAGALVVALIFPHLNPARRRQRKQDWSRQLLALLGLRVNAIGEWNPAPDGMLVANHISFLDIFVINAVAPASFVAKSEVRGWPLLGWLCQHTGTVFLQRGSRRAAQMTRQHLLQLLETGSRVAVFPEGTTSDGRDVLPFHGALFQSAIDAGAVVTPLVLSYRDVHGARSAKADYVGETSLAACLWSVACCDQLVVQIEKLPDLETHGVDRRHLAAHAHRLIAHALKRDDRLAVKVA